MGRRGPKEVFHGKRAVASSQNAIVTQTMLDTMKAGGNAADALVAGSITQAVVQMDHTNHTGSVSCIYWDAKTKKAQFLDSQGTFVDYLPPFRPFPSNSRAIGGPNSMP